MTSPVKADGEVEMTSPVMGAADGLQILDISNMALIETLEALHQWRNECSCAEKKVALVATMGNLHAGHRALIEAAGKHTDEVLVSVFVNPTQFSPHEDYDGYPRTLNSDVKLASAAGATAVFVPTPELVYPLGTEQMTVVDVPAFSNPLEGTSRPGHFRGVASVVLRLFNLLAPDVAVFGEKDYQQLLVIRRMVADLFLPMEILAVPTVRESSGLALSSRNRYLTDDEHKRASALYKALLRAEAALHSGAAPAAIEQAGMKELADAGFDPEYFAVRDAHTLGPLSAQCACVILTAARLGHARLIDNIVVNARRENL